MQKIVTDPFSLIVAEALVGKEVEYEGVMRKIESVNVHARVGTISVKTADGLSFILSMEEKYTFGVPDLTKHKKVKPKHRRNRGKS